MPGFSRYEHSRRRTPNPDALDCHDPRYRWEHRLYRFVCISRPRRALRTLDLEVLRLLLTAWRLADPIRGIDSIFHHCNSVPPLPRTRRPAYEGLTRDAVVEALYFLESRGLVTYRDFKYRDPGYEVAPPALRGRPRGAQRERWLGIRGELPYYLRPDCNVSPPLQPLSATVNDDSLPQGFKRLVSEPPISPPVKIGKKGVGLPSNGRSCKS